ncbi:MAG: hypothetical protein FWD19_05650 [Defluviitaleaceae bacterium]|nr:hypothetical protein [Defluviitaleaceae bacterium]
MNKNLFKKKRVLFPLIFFGEIIIVLVIGEIFNLETNNSPLGAVYAYVMGFTLLGFIFKILKDHKSEISNMKIPLWGSVLGSLYLVIVILIVNMIALTIKILYSIFAT